MKLSRATFLFFTIIFFYSCNKPDAGTGPVIPVDNSIYFPPLSGSDWDTKSALSLGWNETELNNLYTYLQSKNTKAFLILQNGKIVSERYFGTFTVDSNWYWASAGKTLTAFLTGLAQEQGILNINNKTSQYLGTGWTSLSPVKEDMITVRHQLTMTSGLDDNVPDDDCTLPSCLIYKSDAGTRWAYHNAAYTLLAKVIENASGQNYNTYYNTKIRSRIGMNGLWINSGYQNIYYSTARSMARFGLLVLNKGKWDQTTIMSDQTYFNNMITSSQNINLSYGYLWWLNGKTSHMLPQSQFVLAGGIAPNAPADMFAALGKNDQKIYVVPSLKLVVIRMGDSAGIPLYALSNFDNELWGKLKTIIGY
jgi:CubicO group peptidase (beta-lactamase class C family)